MSSDSGRPSDRIEAVVLGVGVLALLAAGLFTLFSLAGDDDPDQVSIGTSSTVAVASTEDPPRATYDASISDLSITDEPIVIDADGNIVDPAGGNGGEPLPSESGTLALPDDVFTGSTAPSTTDADADIDADADTDTADGVNLLGGDDPEDKLMPDLICRGLQAAQDEIQDHGVFGSKSKDATGRGRRQLWDRNWVVVGQDPEPGEKIGEFEATLYVVKKSDDENPCS